jgi:DNA-binding NarL/FixJ family response regulator
MSVARERTMILLADDFKPWRLYLRALIEKQPSLQVVDEAKNGLEAVEKAERLQPDFILLDIGMPLLNGIEAAGQIRQVAPNARILMVSIEKSADFIQAALDAGASGYISKAEVASELMPAIDRLSRKTGT